MKEIKCEVIRDLLPLYEDNVVSEETQELVRKHLADCPECREELRKMRVPVSLPPNEDEEAVKRFLEYRAEVRRKQNRKIICAATALAVLVILLLCYILPRNWASLAKLDEVDTLSASITELYFIYPEGEEEDVRADWRRWSLDAEAGNLPAQQLLGVLDNTVFLPKVSNLRNYTPFPRESYTVTGAGSHLNLYLFTQDYQDSFFVTFYSNGLVVFHGFNGGAFVYGTQENPYEALASIVREYGTLQND